MPMHVHNRHRIRVAAPIAQAFMFFTPAGEELWVEGWRPRYVRPADGTTVAGMVFVTGDAEQFTVWHLLDFDCVQYRSRYLRTTPALRTGTVDVQCSPEGDHATMVDVAYTMTALSAAGEASLRAFEGEAFIRMIDDWRLRIEAALPVLLAATMR